ncbi:MAG TPA: class II fructose-bisphosphate aldolase [Terriglobales bacterium]|nr:class II fructose-bisphosphate aldolase [Terriglobales bacterium]HXY48224.1 class II fructose-bisphosphate aldolase [Terriglobales bacterium]
MHVLREILEQEQEGGIAIGHFNVANLVLLKAVFTAAQALKVPSWWAQHDGFASSFRPGVVRLAKLAPVLRRTIGHEQNTSRIRRRKLSAF